MWMQPLRHGLLWRANEGSQAFTSSWSEEEGSVESNISEHVSPFY
jgi:hypothetical protein